MKTLLLIIFPFISYCQDPCTGTDSTPIRQEVFELPTGKFGLVTTNGELYDRVIFGTREFIQANKIVEFQAALSRREAIQLITIKCKTK